MSEGFGPDDLPFGVFSVGDGHPRAGAASGDEIIDLAATLGGAEFDAPTLNLFLAMGPDAWAAARVRLGAAIGDGTAVRVPRSSARLHLPIEVADFVDFFSSLEHATNAGSILRPGSPALQPNWRHLPVGYHGRAGTVVVSGTDIVRPHGQVRTPDGGVAYLPTAKLDVEVELGFVVGAPSELGVPVPIGDFDRHVFGAVILLDWSARDIQSFEYQPLGPFLGKSFATTISPWVVPLSALRAARIAPPEREPEPLPHLREPEPWSLDIRFELEVDGTVLSQPAYGSMYWTGAQQLAHLTSNGASLRVGDLYGTGTVSSFEPDGYGSLLELTSDGASDEVGYLADGADVVVRAWAVGPGGSRLDFGAATGRIVGR